MGLFMGYVGMRASTGGFWLSVFDKLMVETDQYTPQLMGTTQPLHRRAHLALQQYDSNNNTYITGGHSK